MNLLKKIGLLLSAQLLFTVGSASATIIDFEGIAPTGSHTTETGSISSLSQDGFLFSTSHGHLWDAANPNWNGNGTDWFLNDSQSFTIARSDSALFSFDGLDAAQWDGSGLTYMSINGYAGGSLVGSISLQLTSTWTSFDLGSTFSSVDTVTFNNPNNHTGGYDNLVLNGSVSVPEPASIALLGIGLAGIGFSRKKKTS